jgi:hypothetical protein
MTEEIEMFRQQNSSNNSSSNENAFQYSSFSVYKAVKKNEREAVTRYVQ